MNYKKIFFLTFLIFNLICINSFANEIDKLIKDSNFSFKTDVSVFVENKNTKEMLYKKNENKLLNPASILKVLTFGASYLVLGDDYNFETALYQDKDDIYLKLGADVLLTQKDLNDLFKSLKNVKFKKLYIDSSIIDKVEYPSSWLEEDKWPNSRPLTPYIVDNNQTKISIHRSSLATKVDIIQDGDYEIPIINELKLGDLQQVEIKKEYENSSILTLKGTVKEDETFILPVLKPEVNFTIKLKNALDKNKIVYLGEFSEKNVPQNAKKIGFVGHNIKDISKLILHNSDNFASEIVFKVASAKYFNNQKPGNLDDAIKMFNSIYKNFIDEKITVVDASGVSRENKITTKKYVEIFSHISSISNIVSLMSKSNQGTMADRLLFIDNKIYAKTGTLKDFSSLSGVLNTKKDNELFFSIIIQNANKRKGLLKHFEERLVGILYKNF